MGVGGDARIDSFAKGVELFECNIPLTGQDVTCELTPMGGDGEIGVGGEDAEVVEVVGGAAVVSVRVLKLAKVVERGDLVERDLEGLGREVEGEKGTNSHCSGRGGTGSSGSCPDEGTARPRASQSRRVRPAPPAGDVRWWRPPCHASR